MEEFVTIKLHEECVRRMEDENSRQNHRLSNLEKAVEENGKLALSIERLTISVQSMVQEQKAQGERLETLEGRDGEKWRKVVGHIATAIISVVIGYVFCQMGIR